MRLLIAVVVVGLCSGEAAAQGQPGQVPPGQYPGATYPGAGGAYFPPGNRSPVMPNIYNPVNQPLSPYLNLMRGGNPGVNYYYGVRPGTVGGAGGSGAMVPLGGGGGNRPLFFPQLAAAPDPLDGIGAGQPGVLPPAGHPVTFNNTMGFFPAPGGQAGGSRTGLAGIGAGRRK